jgi:hypothetical protein
LVHRHHRSCHHHPLRRLPPSVAVAIARLIVVSLSPSPLGSKSSSSSPPRPREPTNRFDVVVAGSSVVVAPAIPLPSTQSRALTAPVAR